LVEKKVGKGKNKQKKLIQLPVWQYEYERDSLKLGRQEFTTLEAMKLEKANASNE
jgi:hypothetical protein